MALAALIALAAASLAAAAPAAVEAIRQAATPIAGSAGDYDPLLTAAQGAEVVVLGEDNHGAREIYRERSRITERLIREKGFRAVVIEADWPEVERVNRYVRGLGPDETAEAALAGFRRFPGWLWPNAEFRDFAEALRAHNRDLPQARRIGVYGLDVYNLYDAARATIAYLDSVDPRAAGNARSHYRCFQPYPTADAYGVAVRQGARSCRTAAVAVLRLVQSRARPSRPELVEARFMAERHAASAVAAETYYREANGGPGADAWNGREQGMAEAVAAVARHVSGRPGGAGKVVVWTHNSHAGDARGAYLVAEKRISLGQILRERLGERALLVGFLTHAGAVIAAPAWNAPHQAYDLRPARPDSHAGLFHAAGMGNALLVLRGREGLGDLTRPRPQRTFGAVYLPDQEDRSHYGPAALTRQFDAVVYLDKVHALTPLG